MEEWTVKQLSKHLNKSEEIIKLWIKVGKFPHAYRNSDKEGWRIPKGDVISLTVPDFLKQEQSYETELIQIAYQAVTLERPEPEVLTVLHYVGMKQTLDLLLLWRQSDTLIEPSTFIQQTLIERLHRPKTT